MDSLTQITLGAAIGIAIAGRSHGRKAALIGAICGTIPDFDVFIDHGDPVSNFTMHRGFSHSILFALVMPPVFVWLFSMVKWFGVHFRDVRMHVMIGLVFLTHSLLDAMTIYGTQLFWPLPVAPAGVGSIFIIDLLYTLPLLIGVVWFLCSRSWNANKVGLVISTFYLFWSVSAQNTVRDIALKGFDERPSHILVLPTPFNTLLWRVLIVNKDEYEVGYYSLLDMFGDNQEIAYKNFPSQADLLKTLAEDYNVQRLKWFSKGFYAVTEVDNKIILSDLRMGLEPDQYVFSFAVAENTGQGITPMRAPIQILGARDMRRLGRVWDRIWDKNADL